MSETPKVVDLAVFRRDGEQKEPVEILLKKLEETLAKENKEIDDAAKKRMIQRREEEEANIGK